MRVKSDDDDDLISTNINKYITLYFVEMLRFLNNNEIFIKNEFIEI